MEWVLLGVGAFMTLRLRGAQFRLLGEAARGLRRGKGAADGALSPRQAVCTALAGTMGTGNIAGVAGAIALGGPGSVVWMWLAAVLGMAVKYAEVMLSVRYRRRNAQGEWAGGPMYVMEKALGKRFVPLAKVFCLFGMLTSLGVGNATQVNTLSESLCAMAGERQALVLRFLLGVLAALVAYAMLRGGMRRVAGMAEKLLPWVSAVYAASMLCVIAGNIGRVPTALMQMLQGALSPRAAGGALGGISLCQALRVGIARGVFTHEAGMGSSPIAHAAARCASPVEQGALGVVEVAVDTLVFCTLTALGVLASGCVIPYGSATGAEITISALSTVFGTRVARVLLSICLVCFALSTLAAWSFYGLRCVQYMGGPWLERVYRGCFAAAAFWGATADAGGVWRLSERLNLLMTLPNLVCLVILSGEVRRETQKHFQRRKFCKKAQ